MCLFYRHICLILSDLFYSIFVILQVYSGHILKYISAAVSFFMELQHCNIPTDCWLTMWENMVRILAREGGFFRILAPLNCIWRWNHTRQIIYILIQLHGSKWFVQNPPLLMDVAYYEKKKNWHLYHLWTQSEWQIWQPFIDNKMYHKYRACSTNLWENAACFINFWKRNTENIPPWNKLPTKLYS